MDSVRESGIEQFVSFGTETRRSGPVLRDFDFFNDAAVNHIDQKQAVLFS